MQPPLLANEKLIHTGLGNSYDGRIVTIGHLTLTNKRLIFQTHRLNFRQYTHLMPLTNITAVSLRNNLRVFNHGLEIQLSDGITHQFALWRRKRWKQIIEQAIEKQR